MKQNKMNWNQIAAGGAAAMMLLTCCPFVANAESAGTYERTLYQHFNTEKDSTVLTCEFYFSQYDIGEELNQYRMEFRVSGIKDGQYFQRQLSYNDPDLSIDTSAFDNTKEGIYEIKATYLPDPNATCTFKVKVGTPTIDYDEETEETSPADMKLTNVKMELHAGPRKRLYEFGDELNLNDLSVDITGYDENGKLQALWNVPYTNTELLSVDTSKFDNTKEGDYRIVITYLPDPSVSVRTWVDVKESWQDDTGHCLDESYHYEDMERARACAETVSQPDKTVYKIGEKLDLTGAAVDVCGYCGSTGDTWEARNVPITDAHIRIDDSCFHNNEPGEYPIYVYYEFTDSQFKTTRSCETCFYVTVEGDTVQDATEDTQQPTDPTEPVTEPEQPTDPVEETTEEEPLQTFVTFGFTKMPKTVYHVGDELDFSDARIDVSASRADGLEADDWNRPIMDAGYITIDASEFDNTKPGTYTIYVTASLFGGAVTDPLEVTVVDEEIAMILHIPDFICEYGIRKYGIGDKLNVTGITADVACSDKYKEWEILDKPISDTKLFTVDDSAFDSSKPGTYPIYVTYHSNPEVTVSYNVTVGNYVANLGIMFKRVYRIGEELDRSIFVDVISFHEDRIDDDQYTVDTSAFDNTKVGTYPIYVHGYDERTGRHLTESFDVYVTDQDTMAYICDVPKRHYLVGEELDLNEYNSLNIWNCSGDEQDLYFGDDKDKLIFDTSEFDNTKSGTYTIYVASKENPELKSSFQVTVETPEEAYQRIQAENAAAVKILPGDVDQSGDVDILDVITLNRYLLGSVKLDDAQKKAADVNHDDTVDEADSLMLLKYVVELIDTLG